MKHLMLLLAAVAMSGTAATANDYDDCFQYNAFRLNIEGCTRVIERGDTETYAMRAKAFHSRGRAHFEMRNYDLAISDFNMSIALVPDASMFYDARGEAYRAKGDNVRADADVAKAEAIDKARQDGKAPDISSQDGTSRRMDAEPDKDAPIVSLGALEGPWIMQRLGSPDSHAMARTEGNELRIEVEMRDDVVKAITLQTVEGVLEGTATIGLKEPTDVKVVVRMKNDGEFVVVPEGFRNFEVWRFKRI